VNILKKAAASGWLIVLLVAALTLAVFLVPPHYAYTRVALLAIECGLTLTVVWREVRRG